MDYFMSPNFYSIKFSSAKYQLLIRKSNDQYTFLGEPVQEISKTSSATGRAGLWPVKARVTLAF